MFSCSSFSKSDRSSFPEMADFSCSCVHPFQKRTPLCPSWVSAGRSPGVSRASTLFIVNIEQCRGTRERKRSRVAPREPLSARLLRIALCDAAGPDEPGPPQRRLQLLPFHDPEVEKHVGKIDPRMTSRRSTVQARARPVSRCAATRARNSGSASSAASGSWRQRSVEVSRPVRSSNCSASWIARAGSLSAPAPALASPMVIWPMAPGAWC